MSKTIVFKPEFEAKLKKLKIKTKFIKNLKVYINNDSLDYLQEESNWIEFILVAFDWSETPEGEHYWRDICWNK